MGDSPVLVRLLQLSSPALPIGAYSYSQGLEWMVESGAVHDAASLKDWIADLLHNVLAHGEGPVLWRLLDAAERGDGAAFAEWNAWFRASREGAELRAETLQMGGSLGKLLTDLDVLDDFAQTQIASCAPVTLPAAFALGARALDIPSCDAVTAYLWTWLENQVLAALKAMAIGQVAGQKLLLALGAAIPGIVDVSHQCDDDDVSSFAPGLAIASARHETQHSRLFRS
ncbi:MAG: urease accessory protein UreF [Casimicrobiaceae bacterium]